MNCKIKGCTNPVYKNNRCRHHHWLARGGTSSGDNFMLNERLDKFAEKDKQHNRWWV